jgi:hypothetical protein
MTDTVRLRRQPPDRSGPHRSSSGFFQPSSTETGATNRKGSVLSRRKRGGVSQDIVVGAVKLGYKIADEQIRRGQDWARRLRVGSTTSEPDLGTAIDHTMALWRQMATLAVELAESTALGPTSFRRAFERVLRGATDAAAGGGGKPPGDARDIPPATGTRKAPRPTSGDYSQPESKRQAIRCPIEISASMPVRVALDLFATPSEAGVVAYPLYRVIGPDSPQADGQVPAIGPPRIAFEDGAPVFKLLVRDDQPTGQYRGVLMSGREREPLGYVDVWVRPDVPAAGDHQ